jgi:hypothetical protein
MPQAILSFDGLSYRRAEAFVTASVRSWKPISVLDPTTLSGLRFA